MDCGPESYQPQKQSEKLCDSLFQEDAAALSSDDEHELLALTLRQELLRSIIDFELQAQCYVLSICRLVTFNRYHF